MTNNLSLDDTLKLIELKKTKPKYYQQVLASLVDVQLDLIEVSKRINDKLQKE